MGRGWDIMGQKGEMVPRSSGETKTSTSACDDAYFSFEGEEGREILEDDFRWCCHFEEKCCNQLKNDI